MGPSSSFAVPLAVLPVPSLWVRDGAVVEANEAYRKLTGIDPVGRALSELVQSRGEPAPVCICDVTLAEGRRALQVTFTELPGATLVFLCDDGGMGEMAEAVSRAASDLAHARDQADVLERAAESLAALGFTVSVLLFVGDDPRVTYGPTRRPLVSRDRQSFEEHRPTRDEIIALNPRFHERRAAFFPDVRAPIARLYAEEIAATIPVERAGRRAMQLPLFVFDQPFGAVTVIGDGVREEMAGILEGFAANVARALEGLTLRHSGLLRSRLEGLRDAASILVGELESPVSSLVEAAHHLESDYRDRAHWLEIVFGRTERIASLFDELRALREPNEVRLGRADLCLIAEHAVAMQRHEDVSTPILLATGAPVDALLDEVHAQLVIHGLIHVARKRFRQQPIEVVVGPDAPVVRITPCDFSRSSLFFASAAHSMGACGGRVDLGRDPDGVPRVTLTFVQG